MARRFVHTILWALLILVPDLITKLLVQSNLELWSVHPIIPGFFNLTHVRNKGAAFGFLNTTGIDWQVPLFICINVLAIGFILYLLKSSERATLYLKCGLGLILGGAVGNLIDRVWLGFVVDFLDFHLAGYHWPSFNVADIGISVGAFLVILAYYLEDRENASDTA
ncbi:MAG: signal peptidase II [Proteobacteria bacterium]|nr:signal peptidase II [Pseudomonadota bacterium]MBU1610285.1 signal peptidase II [Pseudomonadota bacterium]